MCAVHTHTHSLWMTLNMNVESQTFLLASYGGFSGRAGVAFMGSLVLALRRWAQVKRSSWKLAASPNFSAPRTKNPAARRVSTRTKNPAARRVSTRPRISALGPGLFLLHPDFGEALRGDPSYFHYSFPCSL